MRPWAYTVSHIQHTGSRQDQNQAYAPQGQSNLGQGQVAGEGQSFGLERRRGEASALQGQGKNSNMAAKNDCETNNILRLLLGRSSLSVNGVLWLYHRLSDKATQNRLHLMKRLIGKQLRLIYTGFIVFEAAYHQ